MSYTLEQAYAVLDGILQTANTYLTLPKRSLLILFNNKMLLPQSA